MAWSRLSPDARGYGATWKKVRAVVLKRDDYLCQACARKGRVRIGNECHHRKPRAHGGTDDPSNLETLCHDCHLEADAAAQGRKVIKRGRVALDGTLIGG